MKKALVTLSSIALFVLVFSCKEEKKEEVKEKESPKEEIVEDNEELKIKLDLISDQDATFQFVFSNKENPEQSKKVFKKILKSEDVQTLEGIYDLKTGDFPQDVTIILGHETPKNLIIKNIELTADGNLINISGTMVQDYFIPNSYIEYNKDNSTLKTIKVKDSHLPIMKLKQKAVDSLMF